MIVNVQRLNYDVSIDLENIPGDVLTSMASAIENAFVVLMAINEQYFQSRYCRLGKIISYRIFLEIIFFY